MNIDNISLNDTLINNYGYQEKQAEFVLNDLSELDSRLEKVFEAWMSNNANIQDYEVSDNNEVFSIAKFMRDYKMNFISALLTMDWILKEPKEAIPLIKLGIK